MNKIKKSIVVLKGMTSNDGTVNKIIMADLLHMLDNEIDKLPKESSKKNGIMEAIGWAYADCCATLDKGNDPRQTDMADVIDRAEKDLGLAS